MIKILDDDKEYSLGSGNCLIVKDRHDLEDVVQVDAKDFSEFEQSVWDFLEREQNESNQTVSQTQ